MDRFEVSRLRGYYGALLTDRQNEMLVMHYDEDLSFGEIAEICGVSRQAVLDGINKGERHLAEFEKKLRLADKDERIRSLLQEVSQNCDGKMLEVVARIESILEE